jgi:hypothetical protein
MPDAAEVCTAFKRIIMIIDHMIVFIFTLFQMLPIVFLGRSGGSSDSAVSSVSSISSIEGCVVRFSLMHRLANGLSVMLVSASPTCFHLSGGGRPQSTSF